MTTWHYTILGAPVSSTNSHELLRFGPRVKLVPSKAQRAWEAAAIAQLTAQRRHGPIDQPCAVTLTVFRARNTGDTDNFAKAPLDCLAKAGILANDRVIDEVHIYRDLDRARPRIEIALTVLPTDAPQSAGNGPPRPERGRTRVRPLPAPDRPATGPIGANVTGVTLPPTPEAP